MLFIDILDPGKTEVSETTPLISDASVSEKKSINVGLSMRPFTC